MTNTTMKKIILSATTAMFLTACGGGGSSVSAADTASAKIQAYAENNSNPMPSLQDYKDAGVAGVTAANLDALNALVDSKGKADVDSLTELNALVKTANTQSEVNKAPTANAGSDVSVEVNKAVELKGSGTDTDGTIASYKWTKGTTELGTSATLSYTPIAVGTDTLTLTVTDNDGATASDTVNVTVTAVVDTEPPVVTITGTVAPIFVGGTYTELGATVTDNVDTGLTATPSGTVNTAVVGSYTITYTAIDAAGNEGRATRTVTVKSNFSIDKNGDTVTDAKTGLVWDNAITTDCTDPKRVPTIEQFQSIIDYTEHGAAVNEAFTASTNEQDDMLQTSDGWTVDKYGGIVKGTAATKTICVDDTNYTSPTPNFTRDTDTNTTVIDNVANLVWQDDGATEIGEIPTTGFTAAKEVCDKKGEGWRLPTIVELDSIYNRETNRTVTAFKNDFTGYTWSSTEGVVVTDRVWTARFHDGGDIEGVDKTTGEAFVRCVKEK